MSLRPAGGSFGAPSAVGSLPDFEGSERVVLAPDGSGFVAYGGRGAKDLPLTRGRAFDAAGRLGAVQAVGGNFAGPGVELAMDSAGTAVVAYVSQDSQRAVVAQRPAGGSFGAPQPVDHPGSGVSDLALGVSGRTTAIALRAERGIAVSVRGAPRRFPAATLVGAPTGRDRGDRLPQTSSEPPSVTVNPAGDVLVAYEYGAAPVASAQHAVLRRRGRSGFDPVEVIDKGRGGGDSDVALAADGTAFVAWVDASERVVLAARRAGSAPARRVSLAAPRFRATPLRLSADGVLRTTVTCASRCDAGGLAVLSAGGATDNPFGTSNGPGRRVTVEWRFSRAVTAAIRSGKRAVALVRLTVYSETGVSDARRLSLNGG